MINKHIKRGKMMNLDRILPRSPSYKSNVKLLKEDKLKVKGNFEAIDISNGLDWNYKHQHNSRTYQTYLHSLTFIRDLVLEYKDTKDKSLLETANLYLNDWIRNHKEIKFSNSSWNEHAVSTRIQNIIYFQKFAEENKIDNSIFQHLLKQHCTYLSDDKFYKENNHGIMMDSALLLAANHLSDKVFKELYTSKALSRLKLAVRRDFTRNGLHLENSPEYHRLVLNLYDKVNVILQELNLSLGNDIKSILTKGHLIKSTMMYPNKQYPLIGDTGTIVDSKIVKRFNDFIDYEAGFVILQNKNIKNDKQSTYFTFTGGFHSKVHKHKDDLSVTLFMGGNEVLTDSGKYSYDIHDPIRQHIISPQAHNTIYIEGKTYSIREPINSYSQLGITKVEKYKGMKIVTGVNNLYENVNITRTCFLSDKNYLITVDNVRSSERQIATQNFNFPLGTDIKSIDEHTFEININNKLYILRTQKTGTTEVKSNEVKGFISHRFSKAEENKRITFSKDSKRSLIITLLIEKDEYENISDIQFENNHILYDYREVQYKYRI